MLHQNPHLQRRPPPLSSAGSPMQPTRRMLPPAHGAVSYLVDGGLAHAISTPSPPIYPLPARTGVSVSSYSPSTSSLSKHGATSLPSLYAAMARLTAREAELDSALAEAMADLGGLQSRLKALESSRTELTQTLVHFQSSASSAVTIEPAMGSRVQGIQSQLEHSLQDLEQRIALTKSESRKVLDSVVALEGEVDALRVQREALLRHIHIREETGGQGHAALASSEFFDAEPRMPTSKLAGAASPARPPAPPLHQAEEQQMQGKRQGEALADHAVDHSIRQLEQELHALSAAPTASAVRRTPADGDALLELPSSVPSASLKQAPQVRAAAEVGARKKPQSHRLVLLSKKIQTDDAVLPAPSAAAGDASQSADDNGDSRNLLEELLRREEESIRRIQSMEETVLRLESELASSRAEQESLSNQHLRSQNVWQFRMAEADAEMTRLRNTIGENDEKHAMLMAENAKLVESLGDRVTELQVKNQMLIAESLAAAAGQGSKATGSGLRNSNSSSTLPHPGDRELSPSPIAPRRTFARPEPLSTDFEEPAGN